MSDKPSDTPRTDVLATGNCYGETITIIALSRQLEHELTSSAAKCAELERQLAEKGAECIAVAQSELRMFYQREDALHSLGFAKEENAKLQARVKELERQLAVVCANQKLLEEKNAASRAQVRELADALESFIGYHAVFLKDEMGPRGVIEQARAALARLGGGTKP
jgi:hypothetical protein